MARKVTVSENDTFKEWQDKTNDISNNVGEPEDLLTTNTSDLVSAINEVNVVTAARGALLKNSNGELLANVDDSSIDISSNNKLEIKNDGVRKEHLNPDVAGDGLQQTQDEGIQVKVGEDSGITLTDGRVALLDNGIKVGKHAKQVRGSVLTWGPNDEPVIIGPGTDGQILQTGGPDADLQFSTAPGTKILGHSGYLLAGFFSGTANTLTIKSSVALTNPVNVLSTPGGLKIPGENQNALQRNVPTDIQPNANYGMLWSCDEGMVVVRDIRYYSIQVTSGDDTINESVMFGIRVFNYGGDTYITFRVLGTQGGDTDSGQALVATQHFILAELFPGATNPTVTYYDGKNVANSVDAWVEHTDYVSGDVVSANDKIYQNMTAGTNRSGAAATQPTHRYFHDAWGGFPGNVGKKQYQNLTWFFLGDI